MVVPSWRVHPDGSANYGLMLDDVLYTCLAAVTAFMIAVVYMLSKNRYRAALNTHASRFFSSQREMEQQQKTFLGSMQAEEDVMRVLKEEGWRHVFLRRRVPISRLGHNREIDVVAVGKVILVVEVKHWRGYVWSNGRNWYQAPNYQLFFGQQQKKEARKARSGGGGGSSGAAKNERVEAPATREFEDVQEDNVMKAAALRRYIENTKRVALPDVGLLSGRDGDAGGDATQAIAPSHTSDDPSASGGPTKHVGAARGTWYSDSSLHKQCGVCVVPVVLFTHPTVKLDPVTLKKERYVFTMDTFRVFAREALRGNVSAEAPNAVVELTHPTTAFLAYQLRRVVRHVPLLGSLVLPRNSGYLLNEDLQEEVAYAVDILRTWDLVYLHDGRMVTGDVVKVEAPSGNCMYERKHLLDVNIRWNSSAVIGMLKTLVYNEAGSVELVLTTAKRLAVKKNENKPRDSQGNIRFTMQSKKHANHNLNDRLVVKPAGSAGALQSFALIDIKEVRLSHHLYESEKNL